MSGLEVESLDCSHYLLKANAYPAGFGLAVDLLLSIQSNKKKMKREKTYLVANFG